MHICFKNLSCDLGNYFSFNHYPKNKILIVAIAIFSVISAIVVTVCLTRCYKIKPPRCYKIKPQKEPNAIQMLSQNIFPQQLETEKEPILIEKSEPNKAERNKVEQEEIVKEKAVQEGLEQEKVAKEKAEQEKAELEIAEKERVAKEKAALEKAEQEKAAKILQTAISSSVDHLHLKQFIISKNIKEMTKSLLPQIRQLCYTNGKLNFYDYSVDLAEDGQVTFRDNEKVANWLLGMNGVEKVKRLSSKKLEELLRKKFKKNLLKHPCNKLDLVEHFTDCILNTPNLVYYHGTKKEEDAQRIKFKGFDLTFSMSNNQLDGGEGVYLAHEESVARGYGNFVIKAKIKATKLASVDDEIWKGQLLAHFTRVADTWISEHPSDIDSLLAPLISLDPSKWYKSILKTSITNFLFTDYFASKGYQGIVTINNLVNLPQEYTSIFDPKDIEVEEVI